MDAIGLAAAVFSVLVAGWCVSATLPLRSRVSQLELERPLFLKQLQGLLDETEEQVERAASKQKRADNMLRAASQMRGESVTPQQQQQPLRAVRGTYLEPL